jgi:hypothetical protein
VSGRLVLPLAAAALLRLALVLAFAREEGDVARYKAVAVHLLDVSPNPYQAPRLYPYPPVWMWAEAGSEAIARRTGLPFAVLVKLPVLAADVAIVAVLAQMAGPAMAWAWALHPVALLIGAVHGQFDAIALLFLLLAVVDLRAGRLDRSALGLAMAIALKSFPVLLVPILVAALPSWSTRLRYAALATLPVAAILLPFALHDAAAVRRELAGYGGVADFGWIAALRGVRWLGGEPLASSAAKAWPLEVGISKAVFLAAWAAFAAWTLRARVPDVASGAQAVLLGFLGLYGAISAQYLLWAVPLGLLVLPRAWSAAYAACATVSLLGFYGFFLPRLLWGDAERMVARPASGTAWAVGLVLVELVVLAGLALSVRRARQAAAA